MTKQVMEQEMAEHIANVLKALAHPVRLQIVELLVDRPMCVGDIAAELGGKQSITSQQVNLMKNRGVLSRRREGSKVYYYIENENIIRLLDCMYSHCQRKDV